VAALNVEAAFLASAIGFSMSICFLFKLSGPPSWPAVFIQPVNCQTWLGRKLYKNNSTKIQSTAKPAKMKHDNGAMREPSLDCWMPEPIKTQKDKAQIGIRIFTAI